MARLKALSSRLSSPEARLKAAPKTAERFYQSNAWRGLVQRIKRQRGNHCEVCGSTNRVIADHIVERKDEGADLDPTNIQLLCNPCHAKKTAKARAARANGETLKGKPKHTLGG